MIANNHSTVPCRRRSYGPRLRRRGSALILVIFILVLLLVIGMAFLSGARQDRASGQAAARRNNGEAAVQATIDYIGQTLADDWVEFATGDGELEDAPDDRDAWLSATEGHDDRGNLTDGRWNRWVQITKLGAGFVRKDDPLRDVLDPTKPLDTESHDVRVPQPKVNDTDGGYRITKPNDLLAPEEIDKLWAKVDPGTRARDAKYVRLPIPRHEGLLWLAAVRVVDNSGMVNVNAASQVTNGKSPALGKTPADLDLYGLQLKTERYGVDEDLDFEVLTSRWAVDRVWAERDRGFLASRLLEGHWKTASPTGKTFRLSMSADERQHVWDEVGSRLREAWRLDVASAAAAPTAQRKLAFGPTDEADFRLTATGSGYTVTSFERSLTRETGADGKSLPWVDVNYNDGSVVASTDMGRVILPQRSRTYLTTYNGARMIKMNEPMWEGDYRAPMPRWIDALDNQAGLGLSIDVANPIPYFKLNPNTDTDEAISDLLVRLFNDGDIDGSDAGRGRYLNDYERANRAAYALAANILAYRTPTPYDVRLSRVLDVTGGDGREFYGVKLQPYLSEVVTLCVNKGGVAPGGPGAPPTGGGTGATGGATTPMADPAPGGGTAGGTGGSDVPGTGGEADGVTRMVIVEFRNPHSVPVELEHFNLQVGTADEPQRLKATTRPADGGGGGGATTQPSGQGVVPPRGALIVYSHPELKEYVDARVQRATEMGESDVKALEIPLAFTDFGDGAVKLSVREAGPATTQPATPTVQVVVDRLRASAGAANWPAAAPKVPGSQDSPTVTASSLRRDSRDNLKDGAQLTDDPAKNPEDPEKLEDVNFGGVGLYVFEDRGSNVVVTKGTPEKPEVMAGGKIARKDVASRLGFRDKSTSTTSPDSPTFEGAGPPPGDGTGGGGGAGDAGTGDGTGGAGAGGGSGAGEVNPEVAVDVRLSIDVPAMQIPIRNGMIESVGEIGLLFTVSHTDTETFGEEIVREIREFADDGDPLPPGAQAPIGRPDDLDSLTPAELRRLFRQPTGNFSRVGRLRWAEFARTREPKIPVAMAVFDAFEVLGAATNRPMLHGRLNLNTAPLRALEALPYMSDFHAGGKQFYEENNRSGDLLPVSDRGLTIGMPLGPATGIVAYRDKLKDTFPPSDAARAHKDLKFDFSERPPGWRTGHGFASIGEMLGARDFRTRDGFPEYSIDVAARDRNGETFPKFGFSYKPAWAVPRWQQTKNIDPAGPPADFTSGDFVGEYDDGIDDVRKQLAVFLPASNLVDLRSDVYTAHFAVYGMRYEPPVNEDDPADKGRWVEAVVRRFSVMYDRSNVEKKGDKPRVLMVVER